MNSRIREAICLKTQPVAVIQTDHLPPMPKDGKPNTMAVFSPVWRMRPKERPWCFKHTRMPVRAAELGWGLRNCLLTRWRHFSRKERRDMAAWRIKRRLI